MTIKQPKIYGIETTTHTDHYGNNMYRWYSMYNNARGPWVYNKKDASTGGKEHETIIKIIHGIEMS